MVTLKADVLIIGAGVIGSAIADALAKRSSAQVLVVDLDLAGEWSSSELNAGGVRATWSQAINLEISKASINYFSSVAEQVGYHACGYLWMHRADTFAQALKAREMHVAHGWDVEVLDVKGLQARAPFIDKTEDLAGALFGKRDGLINPNRLKDHYREKAKSKNAQFLDSVYVTSAKFENGGHVVRAFQFKAGMTSEQKKKILSERPRAENSFSTADGEWVEIHAQAVVNAAGAWAPELAKILGYDSPSEPVRRQVSLFHARDLDLTPYGMMIDPSGVYFHPEAIYGLAGFATVNEPAGYNFEYDGESFFENQIWPALYERAHAFESLRHVSGWAGLYENSPDHHAIIGRAANAPGRIFEAHSFSGHGVMQSYGVGLALAELICDGQYTSFDLDQLSAERFRNGKTIPGETWII